MAVNAFSNEVSLQERMHVQVRPYESADDAAWDTYAKAHPHYTLYHGRAFHDSVVEAFRKPSHRLIANEADGRVVGVLPLIRQKSWLFGDRLVSLPYANHGGPLADSPQIALAMFKAGAALGDELGCDRVEVRDHEARDVDWTAGKDKVLMTLALPDSPEALGKAIGAKLRSQCRRALKEGATVAHGGAELIPEFYRVFAVNMRDLGTPVYPRRWFEVLAQRLGEAMRLVVVRLGDKPVAGCVLMRWGATMEIPWAASDREFNRYAVNMLLYREALDFAIESDCRLFDFGRSTRGAGTWKFKKQWGAEERQIWWRVWGRGGVPSQGKLSVNPDEGVGAKGVLRKAWTRLPLGVANRVGRMISPELPW
jgi:FemAB-related protein (PEP-CTERM system-associated)